MPAGGDLDIVYSMTNGGGKRLLELPYIYGSGEFATRTGVAIDVDGFALGVRMANVSAELAYNFVAGIEGIDGIDGQLSYGIYELGDDWSWEGSSVCLNADIGAGLIFSASVNAGLEIRSILFDDYDQSFEYYGQWPSEEEIITPGWHGIENSTWYTADVVNACFTDSSLASLQRHKEPFYKLFFIYEWLPSNLHLKHHILSVPTITHGDSHSVSHFSMTVICKMVTIVA